MKESKTQKNIKYTRHFFNAVTIYDVFQHVTFFIDGISYDFHTGSGPSLEKASFHFTKRTYKQESIPVGCVPPGVLTPGHTHPLSNMSIPLWDTHPPLGLPTRYLGYSTPDMVPC